MATLLNTPTSARPFYRMAFVGTASLSDVMVPRFSINGRSLVYSFAVAVRLCHCPILVHRFSIYDRSLVYSFAVAVRVCLTFFFVVGIPDVPVRGEPDFPRGGEAYREGGEAEAGQGYR